MADESIIVEVKDRIDPRIKVNLEQIGRSASSANSDIALLKRNLQSMGGGLARDLGRLAKSIETVQNSAGRYSATVAKTAISEIRLATEATKANAALSMQSLASSRAAAANSKAAAETSKLAAAESRATKEAQNAARATTQAEQASLRLAAAKAKQAKATDTSGLAIKREQQSMRLASVAARAKEADAGGGGGLMNAIGGAAMRNPYTAAAAAMVAGATVVGKYADSYNVLRNRIQVSTGSLETVGPLIDRIREIANKTAAPIDETGEAFVRFERALKPLGKTQEQTLQFTETLQTMLFRYGKSGSEAASATLQLTQAMGKGKLDGDEFKSVMENLPELGSEIAKQLGVTRGELLKLAPEGKITGEVIYNAMVNAKAGLSELPQPLDTVDASFTRLSNNATQFFGELKIGQAIVGTFTGLVNALSEALEKTDNIDNIEERVKKLAAANAEYLKTIAQPGNEAAKRDADRQKAYVEADKTRTKFVGGQEDLVSRELELARMSEKDRFVAGRLDKVKADALKDEISLSDGYLEGLEKQLGTLYKIQETQKGGAKGTDRALELEKVNRTLDHQISRMFDLADVREANARYDSIEESLFGKKIKLTDEESRAIYQKIEAIQTASRVQAEYDRIFAEAVAPARDYLDATEAAARLLQEGSISEEQYARVLHKANTEMLRSTDLLYETDKQLREQAGLLQLNSREREIESQVLALVNAQAEKGVDMSLEEINAYRQKYVEIRRLNEERTAEESLIGTYLDSQRQANVELAAFLKLREQIRASGSGATSRMDQAAKMGVDISGTETAFAADWEARNKAYANIEKLRQADVINEQEASAAKVRAWRVEQQQKLDLASGFFSNFEGMQRSNIEAMAAIGKAAAIANTTIKTYESATAAYAAMAGIPGVGPVLGAAAAAGAIASGMANVAAIASQPTGFKSGGYTGDGGTSSVAGVVHGGEYVLDANTTSRLGKDNLDALRRGDSSGVADPAAGGPPVNVTVIVVQSREEALSAMKSAAGKAIIVDTVGENSRQLGKVL